MQPSHPVIILTPAEHRPAGQGLAIRYGIHDSPFGACLVADTARGICKLGFFDTADERTRLERELRDEWPDAAIKRDDAGSAVLAGRIFSAHNQDGQPLRVLLHGTPFQLQVWAALLAIPAGTVRSYQEVADDIGRHTAVRAVASAIARNRVGYLVPCHRVIRADGKPGHYRWGDARKEAMIDQETSGASRQD